jgi:hypothetical protein
MAKTEEGGLIPPCTRADGTYHIDGVLELINRDMQYELFKQLLIELRDHKANKVLFMAPLPCYLEASCCGDKDHVANRAQEDFKKKMEEGIYAARQNLKNFAFRNGLRNCVTISTWGKVKHTPNMWETPTKLRTECYGTIAEAVEEAVANLGNKRAGGNLTVEF